MNEVTGNTNKTAPIERSEEAARLAVLEAFQKLIVEIGDDLTARVVNKDLVTEVFKTAWRRQFDEDRSACRREIQGLIRDRVAEVFLDGEGS